MSNYIRQIQTTLKEAGVYEGAIDGIAGPQTVAAVNAVAANEILDAEAKRAVAEQAASIPEHNEPAQASVTTVKNSGFVFGKRSLDNLKGVNPQLVKVVQRALQISPTDFMVLEGLRTKTRQAELVRKGASKTMNSKHLTGHAVDIVPLINGKVSWDFNHYYPLAKAMSQAATELNVNVRWGGAWTNVKGKSGTPQEWVAAYRKGGGKFLDGPHFELV